MRLEALVVSQEAEVMRVVRRAFAGLGIAVEECSSPARACALLDGRKLDALVVDCDDLRGAPEVLRHARQTPLNRACTVFALLHGATTAHAAFTLGANFVLDKPLALERLARSLRIAHALMTRERRRYFRHPVDMRLALTTPRGVEFHAAATDLSEGGLAAHTDRVLPAAGLYKLRFLLPGTRVNVEAFAELAWSDGAGRCGLRFCRVLSTFRGEIERWLAARLESAAAPLLSPPSSHPRLS